VIDAVILAGGKSERLRGIVPPYHKPFLVINGKALIVHAVDEAHLYGAERVIVVATGENALPIHQLIGHRTRVRTVLAAGGPGRALSVGLELCTTDRVLVMMGDNIFATGDVGRIVGTPGYAIGVQSVPWADSHRFTRRVGDSWSEGETISSPPSVTDIWCGPLLISRQRGLLTLYDQEKIGPFLNEIAPDAISVQVRTIDVGIPDVVTELTS
jgi:MobA-like NTP transferase domain